MALWRELLLKLLVLVSLSLVAGGAVMILHGVLLFCRQRCSQSLAECVPRRALGVVAAAGTFTLLLITQADTVPWEWLADLALLVVTAPALLTWLGPLDEHLDASRLCQIGRGSAYSHFYGYLRLMRGQHEVRKRLEDFKRDNPAGLSIDVLEQFFSDAVVVLAPVDGKYPDKAFKVLRNNELRGVSSTSGCVPHFRCTVGGNYREYVEFSVHKVTSSNGKRSQYVALDKITALSTLRKLRDHGPAGLKLADCQKQMEDMMDELEKIVASCISLEGQIKLIRYIPGEHVGDAILKAVPDAIPAAHIRR